MKALLTGFLLAWFKQLQFIAALLIFALMLWGCDDTFRRAEKTYQDYQAQKLHEERSKDFGKATPVEVINPFASGKVMLK